MALIDAHAHYYWYHTKDWLTQAKEIKETIILNGVNKETNDLCIELAKNNENLKAAIGYHPTEIKNEHDVQLALEEIKRIKKIVKENKKDNPIVAIAEIGLDYYHTKEEYIIKLQKKVFIEYIKLAEDVKLPIIIHARNAVNDVLEILIETKFSQKVILHCLEASKKNIQEAVQRGYYFTIPASIKRNEHFQRLLEYVPVSKMFTETDAPYQGPVKGEQAMPIDIKESLSFIADKTGLDKTEVEHMIYQNFMKVF